MTNTAYGTGRWDVATQQQRDELASILERHAALLRRGSFSAIAWVDTTQVLGGNPAFPDRSVMSLQWYFGGRDQTPMTFEQYKGRWSGPEHYHSVTCQGRSAKAYLNQHYRDRWHVQVHQSDDSHLGEVWFGGHVLRHRGRLGPMLGFSRAEAERIADEWAHLGELPPCDLAPSGGHPFGR